MSNYEVLISNYAKKRKVDGVICGHIHHAVSKHTMGIHYINDGDWVESCTALVEHFDGSLELIDWNKKRKEIIDSSAASWILEGVIKLLKNPFMTKIK